MFGGSRGPLRAQGLVLTGSPLLSLPLWYTLFSCMTTSSGHTNTHTHRYTENIHFPEVGRSGAERWDPADSTGCLGSILILMYTQHTHTHRHMHRHLHGGPLQTHSTACTALSENATVHSSEECLSIQMGYRQTRTQIGGISSRPHFTNQHVTLPAELE